MNEALQKLLATLCAELEKDPAEQNRETVKKTLCLMEGEAKKLGGDGPGAFETFKKDVQGQIDLMARQIAEAKRLGLSPAGRGTMIPAGRAARLEMLADRRAFLDDGTAERFGAFMAVRYGGDRAPARAKEIAKEVEKEAARSEKAYMDPTTGASGEYAIPDQFRPELIRNVEAIGLVFTLMRRVPLLTIGQTTWPKRTAGLTAYPTAAAAAITQSIPTLGVVTMQPVKWATLTGIPNEFFASDLLVELGQWIGVEIAYALAYAFDNAVSNGDGTAAYGGITGILQSATIADVTAAAHTTGATLDGADVRAVAGGVTKDYALRDPRWVMSLSLKGQCRGMVSTTGQPLWDRGGSGEPATIDSYPYVVSQRFPAIAAVTAAKRWCAFGTLALSHYFGLLGAVRIDTSREVGFTSDLTFVRGISYVDCKEVDAEAVVCGKTHA